MERLFDDIERTFLDPADYNESTYDYYNRSARKEIQIIRTKIEEWFCIIPDSEKNEIKSRFKHKFEDVFYELFLYNLFVNLGFQITIHPTVPDSNNKPDFLIKKGELEIYVEAKISKGKSDKEEARERMRNHFFNAINRISTDNFILQIEDIEFISGNQPQTKNIISEIEKKLHLLDPDDVENNTKSNGCMNYKIEYNDIDIHLVVNPLPVCKNRRGKSKRRAVGVYPIEIFYGGGEESIRDAINRKAKRYGELDKPFIICINALSFKTSSSDDVDSAIWGTLAFPIDNQGSSVKNSVHKPDGVFYDKSGPRRKHLTAVLVNKIFPSNIPNSNYWLYKNPFSKFNIDFSKLGLKLNYVKDNYVESITGDDLDLILKMKKNWLEY